jgi:hypothetical protein
MLLKVAADEPGGSSPMEVAELVALNEEWRHRYTLAGSSSSDAEQPAPD